MQVRAEAKENGIAEKTLRRAFTDMGGKPHKESFDGGWCWKLPGEDGQDSQDAHPSDVGNLGGTGHLRDDQGADDLPDGGSQEDDGGDDCENAQQVHLAPTRPGPIDLLSPEQHERYQQEYAAHESTPNEKRLLAVCCG